MEAIYELTSSGSHRPVLVAPLGEYMQSRWLKSAEHHAPSVAEIHARDAAATAESQRTGHAAPQHTGFAAAVFAQRKMAPAELPDSVPGVHIAIDQEARRVRIFDPLEHLPNRAEIEAVFLAVYHKHRVPRPEVVYERLSEDGLSAWRTWLDKSESAGLIELVVSDQPDVAPSEQVASPPIDQPEDAPAAEQAPSETQPQESPTQQPAPANPRPARRRR